MKKFFALLFVSTIILAACNSSELSITEVQSVPKEIQDLIGSDYTLQRIYDNKKDDTYITFHSPGTVTAELELNENILNVMLNSANQESNEVKPYIYKITRGDAEYDTINVQVNGENTHFDNSTSF